MAPANLSMADVGVQLAHGLLRLDAGATPAGQILRLPATAPYLIDVSWTLGDGAEDGHQIALHPGDVQHVPVGADEIRLRTVNGDVYELRVGGTAPAEVREHIIDFSEVLDRAGDRQMRFAQELAVRVAPPITVVTGPPGSGRTTTLAQTVRRIQAGGAPCAYHFFESGTPRLAYWDFAERSLIAQLMTRFDAPSWAITMQLYDFLSVIAEQAGSGPVYLVLDDLDAIRNRTPDAFFESFCNVPAPFVFVVSMTELDRARFDPKQVEVALLKGRVREAPQLPERGSSSRRYLDALAVARAPLPLVEADHLRARVDLPVFLDSGPWTLTRSNAGELSITIADAFLRSVILEELTPETEARAHYELARAISRDHAGEESWYGLYHGVWHWLKAGQEDIAIQRLTSTERLQKLIERFGAAITADAIDEIRDATVRAFAE